MENHQNIKVKILKLRDIFKNDSIFADVSSQEGQPSKNDVVVSWKDGPVPDLMNYYLGEVKLDCNMLVREISVAAIAPVVKQLRAEGFDTTHLEFFDNKGIVVFVRDLYDNGSKMQERADDLLETYQNVPESAISRFNDMEPENNHANESQIISNLTINM